MGGLFIVAGLAGGVLLLGDLSNRYLLLALALVGGLTLLGAADDLVKLRTAARGISARTKLAGQTLVAARCRGDLYADHAPLADGLGPAAAAGRMRLAGHAGSFRWPCASSSEPPTP